MRMGYLRGTCAGGVSDGRGQLLELIVGHVCRCTAPHFVAQRLHGGLDPVIYIGITDDAAEFVIPFREHAAQ